MSDKPITVKEFIEELEKLDPNKMIIFSAVGEITHDIGKEDILEHFHEEKGYFSPGEYYEFIL